MSATQPHTQARERRRAISPLARRLIYERDGGICWRCDLPVTFDSRMHIDHVTPLANGGKHESSNLRPAHLRCNLDIREGAARGGRPRVGPRRDMRMPDDFFDSLGEIGAGNASRGVRNLVRFWRENRAAVGQWLADNPEIEEGEPPPEVLTMKKTKDRK